jgi:hypothetical protein
MSRARPTTVAELLDAPFRLVRRDFKLLAPWGVAVGIGSALPAMLQQVTLAALGGMTGMSENPAAMIVWAILANVTGLAGVALYFVGQFMLYTAVFRRVQGLDLPIKTVLKGALDWRLWVVGILEGFINVAGLLLCGLPQLYLLPVLLPSMAIALHEDTHAGAIKRCFQLVHHKSAEVSGLGTWGRAVALLHALTFVTMALSSLSSGPMIIVMMVRVWRSLSDGTFDPEMMQDLALLPVWVQVPLSLLGGAVAGLALLYSVAARFTLYQDLRDTREGVDLAEALDAAESLDAAGAAGA